MGSDLYGDAKRTMTNQAPMGHSQASHVDAARWPDGSASEFYQSG